MWAPPPVLGDHGMHAARGLLKSYSFRPGGISQVACASLRGTLFCAKALLVCFSSVASLPGAPRRLASLTLLRLSAGILLVHTSSTQINCSESKNLALHPCCTFARSHPRVHISDLTPWMFVLPDASVLYLPTVIPCDYGQGFLGFATNN